jgi:hypothetical protein
MKLFSILIAFVLCVPAIAQVPKKIVVEHFTNTLCSICASRNPGFYSNLHNYPEVIHLAVYPSAPYAACVLNQHNKGEADWRTNFYGVYGSTPRLVIQGNVISSAADYTDSNIFVKEKNKMSEFSFILEQKNMMDSIRVKVSIVAEENNTLGMAELFLCLAEDTIPYKGPNGEPLQYDVFRKSAFGAQMKSLNLPASKGDSIVIYASYAYHPDWNRNRMYSIALLQNVGDHQLIQAASNKGVYKSFPLSANKIKEKLSMIVYPNPAENVLQLQNLNDFFFSIYNTSGAEILDGFSQGNSMDISSLAEGIYFLKIKSEDDLQVLKFSVLR